MMNEGNTVPAQQTTQEAVNPFRRNQLQERNAVILLPVEKKLPVPRKISGRQGLDHAS